MQRAARSCCRHGNTRSSGSGSGRWCWRRLRPVRRLWRIGRTVLSDKRKSTLRSGLQNSDHVRATLGKTRAGVGTGSRGWRVAAGAVLVARLGGPMIVSLHGFHAVAHRVVRGLCRHSACIHAGAHLRFRRRRCDRRERQREGDQNRQDGTDVVQGIGTFQVSRYHERPCQSVKTRFDDCCRADLDLECRSGTVGRGPINRRLQSLGGFWVKLAAKGC